MGAPVATYVLGALGAVTLLRALWNPSRALVRRANGIASCPGPDESGACQDTLALDTAPGEPVYNVAGGEVVSVGDTWVHVQVRNEPVILHYFGLKPSVTPGRHVWTGQRIGETGHTLEFGVTELVPESTGAALVSVEPRSWLAARGLSLSRKRLSAEGLWCGPGRHILVPQPVHSTSTGCGLKTPDRGGFALLPVSVTEQ